MACRGKSLEDRTKEGSKEEKKRHEEQKQKGTDTAEYTEKDNQDKIEKSEHLRVKINLAYKKITNKKV